ncbi:iron-containing redox enzyme family protein [Methylohalobius crimeensis]|uniref:iron-containing redox enzyme family protein n=1 Tax=Methylohalobius crimeensis TaxID=244365 RepID=UPI0003B6B5E8|nr:iron-containing redox enzyme family protein [Methylohalobius crimeensis]
MWNPSEAEIDWLRSLFDPLEDPGPPNWPAAPEGPLIERWQSWFAPVGRWEGSWLDGVVTLANAHTERGAALLRLQVAMETAAADRRQIFRSVGGNPSPALQEDLAWLTALERRGELFLPEILGITLAHARMGGGMFSFGRAKPPTRNTPEETRSAAEQNYLEVKAMAEACLGPGINPDRLAAGSAFYHRRSRAWLAAWEGISSDPRRQALALLREKARYGKGLHDRIRLKGRSLDDWLEALADGKETSFPDVFPNSSLGRHFLNQTLAFGGPMFGVFSHEEQAILRRWLEWEETSDATPALGKPPLPTTENPIPAAPSVSPTRRAAEQKPSRQAKLSPPLLYHRLLHPDRFPHSLPAARRYVRKILARAGRGKLPFSYTPEAFCQWMEDTYAERIGPAPARTYPLLSQPSYRWGIEQLAPAILVDGSWLANTLALARTYPRVGRPLWKIFRDELGDGETCRNHANVYRKLLKQANISLPPFDSEAFIHHRGFVLGAFDMPAYLLAIGRLPHAFLPELLGLNLAIELSGLGQTYRRLAREMEYHGFDATIVRLHQSIDNLASGHAALARDAIIAHLETMDRGGEETVPRQWRRIWTGYRSLRIASRRFAWALVIGWGWRFGLRERFLGRTPLP